ncbi:Hypothetical protein AA314_04616 [Archangium gephyra]|uniref:Uncharacterized protein n=1 Tax=Archangium gephyra TaxID=48 RepID=A0AAC8Q8S8_9BACT|nr:Hypothetical protein AA314_04616 [Archangium gephyra]
MRARPKNAQQFRPFVTTPGVLPVYLTVSATAKTPQLFWGFHPPPPPQWSTL